MVNSISFPRKRANRGGIHGSLRSGGIILVATLPEEYNRAIVEIWFQETSLQESLAGRVQVIPSPSETARLMAASTSKEAVSGMVPTLAGQLKERLTRGHRPCSDLCS